jgi:hypothetical protein
MVSISLEELKRIRVQRIPTNEDLYTEFGLYTGYASFDAVFVANYLIDVIRIHPTKALKVSYGQNYNPFNTSENVSGIDFVFIDFRWQENAMNMRRQFELQHEMRLQISNTEVWLLTMQDPLFNLMNRSQSSTSFYFISSNNPPGNSNYWELTHEMPFDAGDSQPAMGYRDANIIFTPCRINE